MSNGHPTTLHRPFPDNLADLEHLETKVDNYLRALQPHYQLRSELRARIAELRGPAVLPKPRLQTDLQRRVAACPRCNGKEPHESA